MPDPIPFPRPSAREAMEKPLRQVWDNPSDEARTLARLQAKAMAGDPYALSGLWLRFWSMWWLR